MPSKYSLRQSQGKVKAKSGVFTMFDFSKEKLQILQGVDLPMCRSKPSVEFSFN